MSRNQEAVCFDKQKNPLVCLIVPVACVMVFLILIFYFPICRIHSSRVTWRGRSVWRLIREGREVIINKCTVALCASQFPSVDLYKFWRSLSQGRSPKRERFFLWLSHTFTITKTGFFGTFDPRTCSSVVNVSLDLLLFVSWGMLSLCCHHLVFTNFSLLLFATVLCHRHCTWELTWISLRGETVGPSTEFWLNPLAITFWIDSCASPLPYAWRTSKWIVLFSWTFQPQEDDFEKSPSLVESRMKPHQFGILPDPHGK